MSKLKLVYFVVCALSSIFSLSTPLQAQSGRLLPIGDAVVYSGADCGRVNFSWIPGSIKTNGRFVSFADTAKALASQITKANKAKNNSLAKKLTKQRSAILKRSTSDQQVCNLLNTGVVPPSGAQSAASGFQTISWTASVGDDLLYPKGAEFQFFCPANGASNSIWGAFNYSSDSSICTAAVHAGLITVKAGGNLKVRVSDGLGGYPSGLRSSINSSSYPSWPKTFQFLKPNSSETVGTAAPLVIAWSTGIGNLRTSEATSYTFICPARGTKGSVWGTNTYTDDSSICTAAVHAGKIGFARGGVVTVVKKPGRSSYTGSARNGVTTSNYSTWGGSFEFN